LQNCYSYGRKQRVVIKNFFIILNEWKYPEGLTKIIEKRVSKSKAQTLNFIFNREKGLEEQLEFLL